MYNSHLNEFLCDFNDRPKIVERPSYTLTLAPIADGHGLSHCFILSLCVCLSLFRYSVRVKVRSLFCRGGERESDHIDSYLLRVFPFFLGIKRQMTMRTQHIKICVRWQS